MTTPLPVLPQLIVEAGLIPDSPTQGSTVLRLNDATFGKLDTATLGTAISWTDISRWVISFTITRPSTRLQGPLWNYQAGTVSILLDNSDGRFDMDNLAGPYVSAGTTQLVPMVPVRLRAVFMSVAYPLYSGFADGWLPGQVTYEGGYAEITLPATDAFKVLAGITLPQIGSPEGIAVDAGTRVADILGRAGWYTSADRRLISTGNSTLQGTTLGDYALSLMQIAVDSEIGQLYVNGAGAVVFRARRDLLTDARSNTVQATFGDIPAGPSGTLNANTGFESGVAPWTAVNGTITSSGAQVHSGSLSALLTPAGGFAQAWIASEMIPVTAGASYGLSGWVYLAAGWVAPAPVTQTFTASTTWVCPAGVTSISLAEAWGPGGGGGGGGTNNSTGGAGGGGAGAYSAAANVAVTPGNSYTVTVGAAGAGGAPSLGGGVIGSDGGGASSFPGNSVTVTAPGGKGGGPGSFSVGGNGAPASGNVPSFGGGAGGMNPNYPNGGGGGSSGGTAAAGQPGGNSTSGTAGAGGAAVAGGGTGGNGARGNVAGGAGGAPGGGGGGGAGNVGGIGTAGGPGGSGQVRITYNPPGGLASVSPNINFYDASGNYLSTAVAPPMIVPTGAWAQFSFTAAAPAAGYMSLVPTLGGSPPATALTYFDDITVTRTSSELAYAAPARASDDTTIANDVQATNVNGGTLQEVKDVASIQRYLFPRTYARSDLILQNDSDALNWAQWVLYVSKDGEDRFDSLAVDPAADPVNLWPQVLGREIGDRIRIVNRPPGVASSIVKDCFIAGITHAWDSVASTWLTTWTLQDASKYGSFLTLDNPTLGRLDNNAMTF
jgi:hypothetical protein